MYSNVVYESGWKVTNGFIESIPGRPQPETAVLGPAVAVVSTLPA
jgi:hypothetical protein